MATRSRETRVHDRWSALAQVRTDVIRDARVIRVVGDLDTSTLPMLASALETPDVRFRSKVIVSLAECRYCDSVGVGLILNAWQRLKPRFFLAIPPHTTQRRIWEIMSLTSLGFICDSVDDALTAGFP